MNKVKMHSYRGHADTDLATVTACGETAFIGKCGDGPDNHLYLIVSDDMIVLAEHPHRVWIIPGCSVGVSYFVDIEITTVRK